VAATDRTSGQYTDQAAITILDVSGANHNKDTPRNATARSAFPPAERAFFYIWRLNHTVNCLSHGFSQNLTGNQLKSANPLTTSLP
jgi:hypothetical protein